jgi:hypothetical protein
MDSVLSTPIHQPVSAMDCSEMKKFYHEVSPESSPENCSSLSSITSSDEKETNQIRINGFPLFSSIVLSYEDGDTGSIVSSVSSVASSEDISSVAPAVPLLKKVLGKRRNKNVSFDVDSPKRRSVGETTTSSVFSTATIPVVETDHIPSIPVKKGRQSKRTKKQPETDSFPPGSTSAVAYPSTIMSESDRLLQLSAKHFQMMEFYGSLVKSTRLLANHAILRFFRQYSLPMHAIQDPAFVNMIFAIASTHESFHPNFPYPVPSSTSLTSSMQIKQHLHLAQQQEQTGQPSLPVNDPALVNHLPATALGVVEESK